MTTRWNGGRSWWWAAMPLALLVLAGCAEGMGPPELDVADLRLAAEAAQQTLENNRIGEAANWNNPASGNRGTVTPTRTFSRDDGRPCRDYQLTATLNRRTRIAQDAACRDVAGTWQSQNHASLAEAIRTEGGPGFGGSQGPGSGVGIGVGVGGRGSGISVGTGIGF